MRDLRGASASLREQALEAQRTQVSGMREQTEHRAGLCFIEIGLHVRPHPGAVGFGCNPGVQGVIPGYGGNVYVLKVPPNTAHQPFPAAWKIKMADGRVLTAQELKNNLGVQHGAAERVRLAGLPLSRGGPR